MVIFSLANLSFRIVDLTPFCSKKLDMLTIVCPYVLRLGNATGFLRISITQMFQLPALVTMSIAATRMYRLLTDFVFESTDLYSDLSFLSSSAHRSQCHCSVQDSLQGSGAPVPRAMQTHAVQIPLNRTEVAVDMSYLQYPTSQTSHHSSYISTDGQGNHKPNELASDEDLEGYRELNHTEQVPA